MICDIDQSYKKFILINKKTGKKKLYGKLTKAVYGTLLEVILLYQKLRGQLYNWKYEQNPYILCIFKRRSTLIFLITFLIDIFDDIFSKITTTCISSF